LNVAKKTALITGMAGQDGSYLAEHLLALGYQVHGIVRRNSVPEHQESRLDHLANEVTTHYGDLLDSGSMDRIIGEVAPDEVYNLGAQSHVRISYEIPSFTASTNALGAMSLLEVLRNSGSQARFYQASSSEMFGDSVDADFYQRETTPMHPVSPYGCSKLFAYHATRNYRKAFGMFAANGILFNHESPRRGSNFVTSKIIKTAVEIKLGRATELVLGNLDSKRDWGHSKDYVRAMHLILTHESPDDFVVATGDTRSVRELVEIVFSELGLNYEHHVRQDPKYMRPEELPYLRGDASKVKRILGWEPKITFDEMVQEMVAYWHSKLSSS
jgi:GDPmannose 4,6-dehydratase